MTRLAFALVLSVAITVQAQTPTKGLILDLDADKGVEVVDGDRVMKWTNQVASFAASDFVKQDQGRKEPGSGRPTLKQSVEAIGGHDTLVFRRQELVNHDEDAFDHLLTGSGYTWIAFISVYEQVVQLKDVNSFFGNLKQTKKEEAFPNVAKRVQGCGRIEMGKQQEFGFVAKILDAGGLVFQDDRCNTLTEAMESMKSALAASMNTRSS
jgi:hypothetical protein